MLQFMQEPFADDSFSEGAGALARLPRIRALMSTPCASVGVGMTCRALLSSAVSASVRVDLHTPLFHGGPPKGLPVHSSVPKALEWLPFDVLREPALRRLHREYLDGLEEGDIAYLWPFCPTEIYEALAARGVTILSEAVNTRMAAAKPVLDAAYEELGLRPAHAITDKRIAEQNLKHALCSASFTPSPATEAALVGSSLERRFIPTSYGTYVPERLAPRPLRAKGAPVRFLFVGSAGVRKGMHHLLRAWRNAPQGACLRIVGEVEPAIQRLFADVLDRPDVSCAGFTLDVEAEYRAADVALLPSLEEGDPIVTYEAAAHGLPVIASRIGAGRIGAQTGAITIVDPAETEALSDMIAAFASSEDLRRDHGARARAASLNYDWSRVAPRRFTRLAAFLNL